MDALATSTTRQRVREVLQNLPQGVKETYDQTMKRIEGQCEEDRTLAEQVISWLTYARQPLSIQVLGHALAVKPNMTEMNLDSVVPGMILTEVCAGLVVVENESNIV